MLESVVSRAVKCRPLSFRRHEGRLVYLPAQLSIRQPLPRDTDRPDRGRIQQSPRSGVRLSVLFGLVQAGVARPGPQIIT